MNLEASYGALPETKPEMEEISVVSGVKFDSEHISSGVSRLPEVVIYEHIDFGGASARTNLAYKYVGKWWNDKISSIVVVSGVWRFYEHINYQGRHFDLGPGYYRWVESVGIPNDLISSFKPIKLTN